MDEKQKNAALHYHDFPVPGKIKIVATKPLTTQEDLALAYSPGVADACNAIVADPASASKYTIRANLVAVVTNGTAVLGLGNIGPLASKPVMEGKAVLFKKFAGIDVFDIELDQNDPDKLIDAICALEPTFGGINLEDIKAPECFYVEREVRRRMNIPVFHDDQHGTAIITAAAVINGLKIIEKSIAEVKIVTSGAGAAGLACLNLLVSLGAKKENIIISDRGGVVYIDRDDVEGTPKAAYAVDTPHRTLAEAMVGSDIFLGVSGPGVVSQDMVKSMAEKPIILALANPIPEIMPELAKAARPDALIATGRSDYPNQVNNVLCFPYIFRGALDVGATTVNEEMKMACVKALAELARRETSDVSAAAYGGMASGFGPDYLIPQPFDPRLLVYLAPAVAKAAMDSGVATRPIRDWDAYRQQLTEFVYKTGLLMKPVFDRAKADIQRVAYAEGEELTTLRAVQTVVDEGLAFPVLIGRPDVIKSRIERAGLRLVKGQDFEIVNPHSDPRFKEYWQLYHSIMERRGVSPGTAKAIVRTRGTAIAALMLKRGEVDAMICGVVGRYRRKLDSVLQIIGLKEGVSSAYALSAVTHENGAFFMVDTYVNENPSAAQLAEATILAAERLRDFGLKPRVALLSHSNFGSNNNKTAIKMRDVLALLRVQAPELEVEGEMHADAALLEHVRTKVFPNSRLSGAANLLVMPTLDAANIAFHMSRVVSQGVSIGPILMGVDMPAHVMTQSATSRRVVNMTAVAAVDAQNYKAARAQAEIPL